MTEILLVRHGQTEWNRFPRFRGRIDVPLNEFGRKQAQATGEWIAANWQVSAVYASPLSRAVQTAEAIAAQFSLPVIPVPDLIDLNFGAWQGKTPEELQTAWPEIYATWMKTPHAVRIPDGETIDEMRARAWNAVLTLAERHPEETIVMVGHTDINRSILLNVLGWSTSQIWQLKQENCAVNQFFIQAGQANSGSINETRHLISLKELQDGIV
jgi:phosphoserine phosphatase